MHNEALPEVNMITTYQRLVNMRMPYLNNLNRATIGFLKKAFHEQLSEQPYIEFILSSTVPRQLLTILDDELYVIFELKCNIIDDDVKVKVEDIKCINTAITHTDTAFNKNNILYRGNGDMIIYEILQNDNRRMFLFRRVNNIIQGFPDEHMIQLLISSVSAAINYNSSRGLDTNFIKLLRETRNRLLKRQQ